ncbi:TetR/AcrR family transcriptional regulator [Streptomyces sp. NBC_00365]|uniref:TetR/AcrR family transcriptional regulator n=1 Tax=Streptomyces sp. NBC_00365 TaxID=2975726 RepID=UPI002251EE87|nr:TetR/AcrR family transcriptional regulator [Streptomyces sp. NBC_00365]MCX5088274.1 TetR/AcrR family transcriptional regulator [Streptomyces sp. NBC_00365]
MARDADLTRQRIMEAALEEFSDKGRAGARVESIAQRAGVSVRMLYVYFGNKDGLYEAVLREHVTQRASALSDVSVPLTDFAPRHYAELRRDETFVRLVMWEGLTTSAAHPPVSEEERSERYAEVLDYLKGRRDAGELDPSLDTEMALLAVIALASFPSAFGQIVHMATGLRPTDPAFVERYEAFLRDFAHRLAPRAPASQE